MSDIHVVPGDMKAAAAVAADAQRDVRSADSAEHLGRAGAAIPGAESVAALTDLGNRWTDQTTSAADSAERLSAQIEDALREAQMADAAVAADAGKVMGRR
ncbi:hypothetical protein FB381_1581 [Nocardioides albertanoniae]|uniref:Uncharacterized protein n=1 Tax=Nocardioides albertanoniae TaxID=1175486 RepID=A0A543A533_9ACTN|nr:hypothetical protein [Nocardioides albertanoniae]TQL67699.1 hypothetical protein FB381_1581 [Nocardioides albertanoniae]